MSSVVAQGHKRISFVDPASFTPHFSWEKEKAVGRFSGDKLNGGAAVLRPYRESRVHCEDISLSEIAEKAGTPTYVYSQAAIGDAYGELDRGLGSLPHTLCFAVKSNGNLAILKYLAGLGSGFDVVSGGELEHLQQIWVGLGAGAAAVFGSSRFAGHSVAGNQRTHRVANCGAWAVSAGAATTGELCE